MSDLPRAKLQARFGQRRGGPAQGALTIVLKYAIFATLWILFSDKAVGALFKDPEQIIVVNMVKGSLFVAVTALLLFVLVSRFGYRLAASDQDLARQVAAKADAEKALQENEEMFRALAEGASDGFFVHDQEGRFVAVNQRACESLGFTQSELLLLGLHDVGLDALAALPASAWADAPSGQPLTLQARQRRKDGSLVPVDIRSSAFDFHERKLYLSVVRDISDSVKAAEALQESETRFTTAFQFLPLALSVSTLEDGRLLTVNEAFLRQFGFTRAEVLGRHSHELRIWNDAEDRAGIQRALEGGAEVLHREVWARRKDGTLLLTAFSGKVVDMQGVPCLLSASVDITARKEAEAEHLRLQAEVQHAQKLESLGSLASGVAHDMNNVLAAIHSVAEVLQLRLAGDAQALSGLDTIAKASDRGRDLVRGLTNFARKDLREAKLVDLNRIVQEEADLLDRTLLQRVQLVLELERPLPRVLGEHGGLGSALMNLCVNAVDAMPKGGTLTLGTRRLDPDQVQLIVRDTGVGMAPEVVSRATEPFFTTKEVGKGTGLGLAMVHGIVKAHHGTLHIQSEPGAGSCFTLTLPVAAPADEDLEEPVPPPPVPRPGRALHILLVDDDELIRDSIPDLLDALGHQATAASGGRQALALLEGGLQVDLAILDLNMPGMSGSEALPHLRGLRPDLPVLVATGYLDRATAEFLAGFSQVGTLAKPYSMRELQTKLREVFPEL